MKRSLFIVAFLLCHSSWSRDLIKHEILWDALKENQQRLGLLKKAKHLKRSSRYFFPDQIFSYDCSGFVRAILHSYGFELSQFVQSHRLRGNGVSLVHAFVQKTGWIHENPNQADVGDFVFFSNTYDRNRDRKNNDRLSHIGIITNLGPDGTIEYIHHLNRGVTLSKMNLTSPDMHRRGEQVINSFLRRRRKKDPRNTQYLSAQLFESFGSLWPNTAKNTSVASLDAGPEIP